MNGVMFGTQHSYYNWKLLLTAPATVSPPALIRHEVEIPGTSTVVDVQKLLTGRVNYKPRDFKARFVLLEDRAVWESIYDKILNYLHGKTMDIVIDSDREYAYNGTLSVDEWSPQELEAYITITAKVKPYKRALNAQGVEKL